MGSMPLAGKERSYQACGHERRSQGFLRFPCISIRGRFTAHDLSFGGQSPEPECIRCSDTAKSCTGIAPSRAE